VYEENQDGSQVLVGGLYGVSIGGYFAGESMFHHKSGASKIALCFLVERLRERGASWIDCQQLTPLFASFGARLVARRTFMKRLRIAQEQDVRLFD
jgi:leucyl/phenylalanyl-tRNA--protein transferase